MIRFRFYAGLASCILIAPALNARNVNYSEEKVSTYTLPQLLVCNDGTSVTTSDQWIVKRRPEILELYHQHVYGRTPEPGNDLNFRVVATKHDVLGGTATRKLIHISMADYPQWKGMEVLLYVPVHAKRPVPVFLGLNFSGNHAVTTEPDVLLSTRWMRDVPGKGIMENRATEASRGVESSRWPLELILGRGYAVATAYYGDLEPDHPEGWKEGVRSALESEGPDNQRKPGDWGAIGAWAWGLSRMLDYCETDSRIDATRAIVIGHSRLGKAALWAGAQDERFAVVISNNSGEGGAAILRRNFGETIEVITRSFPHWFCPRFANYAGRVEDLPVDQHMLIGLITPRPVYIASAHEDRWADPYGEFLSGVYAGKVYELFGRVGLGTETWPPLNHPVGDTLGYHLRSGRHDITRYDWERYLDFTDRHFSGYKGQ